MNHDMTTESPESRVFNVSMAGGGPHRLIVSTVHTVAINEGDTLTWAGRMGDKFHVKVIESEWSIYGLQKSYICHALCEIISWY